MQHCFYIGPLILVALLYQALGFILAFVIKRVFWVPHRFRWGIVVASVWANWGDIRKHRLDCATKRPARILTLMIVSQCGFDKHHANGTVQWHFG